MPSDAIGVPGEVPANEGVPLIDRLPKNLAGYSELNQRVRLMAPGEQRDALRWLGKNDLFFLIRYILKKGYLENPFLLSRCREVQADPNGQLDLWARGHCKAVDVDEIVPTPKGWKKHGELVPGDFVYGPDGKPARVIAKTKVFTDADCYRVTFCDRSSVVVSGDHMWTYQKKWRRRNNYVRCSRWEPATLDTRELKKEVDWAIRIPSHPYPTIQVAAAVEKSAQYLPIDPYVLGVWLGDGSRGAPRVTQGLQDADEMFDLLAATGVQVRKAPHSNAVTLILGTGKNHQKGSSDINNALRYLGIFKCKRIPRVYMDASIEQRFALLQGLMDTDGSCSKACGQASFGVASEQLARDTFDLCQSLGLKATIRKQDTLYKGRPYDVWTVQFLARAEKPPFRLKRKVKYCSPHGNTPTRKVVSIEPVASIPVSCIQVDRLDGLYCVGRHYLVTHNSTIITCGLTIQDILKNPETTACILSYNRPTAKSFLNQIKSEFEFNTDLKELYDDVLYADPNRESPKWSSDEGLRVKRMGNPKENTLEAWGLIDAMPTGRHYSLMVYDDVVTLDACSTPESLKKVTTAWEMSTNLECGEGTRKRYIGTRYHAADTYGEMMKRGVVKARIHRAEEGGKPVFMSVEELARKRQEMGPYVFASQMMQNPLAEGQQTFLQGWLQYYREKPEQAADSANIYLLVDPATSKRKGADYTAMWVVACRPDKNYYLVDGVRKRLSLTERTEWLFKFVKQWDPVAVGYERYGMQSDIEHIRERQQRESFRFRIIELGGKDAKEDRIRKLVPLFENGRIFLPEVEMGYFPPHFSEAVTGMLNEEYQFFPVSSHDDGLDCLARIVDTSMMINFPNRMAGAGHHVRSESFSAEYNPLR